MTRRAAKQVAIKNARSNTITDKEIGLRIRAMRNDQGVSQDELGKLLNVSFQQVQKYEKGTNRISAARLIKIALALNTNPHEILGWDGLAKISGDTTEFDTESYKLARIFVQLPDRTKPAIRSLINSLITSSG
jgi:transcriptional regulator with XRE-family HTH domain